MGYILKRIQSWRQRAIQSGIFTEAAAFLVAILPIQGERLIQQPEKL
jgi:hypothetical protein